MKQTNQTGVAREAALALESLDPTLVRAWEKNNLENGQTIQGLLDKLDKVTGFTFGLNIRLLLATSMLVFAAYWADRLAHEMTWIGAFVFLVLAGSTYYCIHQTSKYGQNQLAQEDAINKILIKFVGQVRVICPNAVLDSVSLHIRQAHGSLGKIYEYSFLAVAIEILEKQEKYDKLRLGPGREVEKLVLLGGRIMELETSLREKHCIAEAFGFKGCVAVSSLFADAKRTIEKTTLVVI